MCEEGACGPGTQEMTQKEQDELVKPCLGQPMGVGSSHRALSVWCKNWPY